MVLTATVFGYALNFDLFDRNNAVALTGRWRATAWRRWRT